MRIRRLGWAGIEIESGDDSVVVDHVTGWDPIEPYIGPPRTPLLESNNPGASIGAFVTHLHSDHTDANTIAFDLAADARLHRPPTMAGEPLETAGVAYTETQLEEAGLNQARMEAWESVQVGPFKATATPAVDGFGDPQISWLIEADDRRIIHCGDTLFHGSWWLVKMRLGPVDAAFLPVNGAFASFPHRQPASGIEASLTPEQAVAAARVLGARQLIPIHYDGIAQPPIFEQTENIVERLQQELTQENDPQLLVMAEGDVLDL